MEWFLHPKNVCKNESATPEASLLQARFLFPLWEFSLSPHFNSNRSAYREWVRVFFYKGKRISSVQLSNNCLPMSSSHLHPLIKPYNTLEELGHGIPWNLQKGKLRLREIKTVILNIPLDWHILIHVTILEVIDVQWKQWMKATCDYSLLWWLVLCHPGSIFWMHGKIWTAHTSGRVVSSWSRDCDWCLRSFRSKRQHSGMPNCHFALCSPIPPYPLDVAKRSILDLQ